MFAKKNQNNIIKSLDILHVTLLLIYCGRGNTSNTVKVNERHKSAIRECDARAFKRETRIMTH